MQLIVDGKFKQDDWQPVIQLSPALSSPALLTYSEETADVLARSEVDATALGLIVPADIDGELLQGLLSQISLLVIEFPDRLDGRGFSLAAICRRSGFGGEIRACGDFIPDQYHHLKACGFDGLMVPAVGKHTELEWRKAFLRFPLRYQDKPAGGGFILARRHTVSAEAHRILARPNS